MKALKIVNKLLVGLIVIAVFFLTVGIAYSYFAADVEGVETNTTITAEAGYMNIIYNGGTNINAVGIGPSIAPFATKTFTVSGTSTLAGADMGYKLTLVIDQNTFTNNAISYTLNSTNTGGNGAVLPTITERQNLTAQNKELGTGKFLGIIANSIHTYELKLYFYETGADQTTDMEKIFKAHIETEKYINPCVSGNCLKDRILAQGGGKAAIEAKGNPSFSQIASSSDTGIYASEDDYGTSYYYRGLKTDLNNNLIFGGFQWKILRINGDGSIRIIYNGTEAQFNTNGTINTTGANTQIGSYAWNTNYNDSKYAGYMYGGANGVASTVRNGTTSVAATYNETSSNAKIQLENWYQTNILGKSLEGKIVDKIYCNDRQLKSEVGGPATGPGYGNTGVSTDYAPSYRLNTTKKPTLKCTQKNDRFTKSDSALGNGNLTYSVGLITIDELLMAGLISGSANTVNYLYTNQAFWTFSPGYMILLGTVLHGHVYATGEITTGNLNVTSAIGLRPVLNLSSDVTITGEGSATNPFRVV